MKRYVPSLLSGLALVAVFAWCWLAEADRRLPAATAIRSETVDATFSDEATAEAEDDYASLLDEFEPDIEEFDNGYIDWNEGYYYAKAVGYPDEIRGPRGVSMARRAAEVVALREIIKMAANIRINDEDTVGTYGDGNYVMKLTGRIRDFEIVDGEWMAEAAEPHYEMTVRAPIYGVEGVFWAIYQDELTRYRSTRGYRREPRMVEAGVVEEGLEAIIVDARGLGMEPALCPTIRTSGGDTIYSIDQVDPSSAKTSGLARYVKTDYTFEELKGQAKAGQLRLPALACVGIPLGLVAEAEATNAELEPAPQRPRRRFKRKCFVVKAGKAEGEAGKTELVVSSEAAAEIQGSPDLLSQAKVIIITDSATAGVEGSLPREWRALAAVERR